MADVRNCKKCGKIFNYIGGIQICYVCRQGEEEDFQTVKKYLYDNPGASLTQVSVELDMSVEKIKRFLREGRLEIMNDDGNLLLECENCGKSIRTGRYCDECEKNLFSTLKTAAIQFESRIKSTPTDDLDDGKMRYRNK